ncbi:MAG TPA: NfeD family protein, partial [Planctomycetaceae bacterium]
VLIAGGDAPAGFGPVAAAIARDAAIGLVAAKLLTQPLRGKFETTEPNKAETLVGRTCVVTTSEVDDRFGQARVEADGAPLLLHVRGPAGTLAKNDPAVIVGYDGDRGVFLVEPMSAAPSEPARREAV